MVVERLGRWEGDLRMDWIVWMNQEVWSDLGDDFFVRRQKAPKRRDGR